MRKIKEVLRLRFDLGLHQDQIARSCSIGQATVHRYLEKAAAANLVWPLLSLGLWPRTSVHFQQTHKNTFESTRDPFELIRSHTNLF